MHLSVISSSDSDSESEPELKWSEPKSKKKKKKHKKKQKDSKEGRKREFTPEKLDQVRIAPLFVHMPYECLSLK